MYVKTYKANVYSYNGNGKSTVVDSLEFRDKVTAIAVQDILTCVLYEDSDGNEHAGWITSKNLQYSDPLGK
ncbi:MAG: hypothetical protein Q4F31_06495 [Eubacteriales bacterium]|nr:hypothetical protein [Eubacteriales bacterium]